MIAIAEKTVRDLVLESPAAARVFESLGIDYCCGGQQTLAQACQAAAVPVAEVEASLSAAPAAQDATDWRTAPLAGLIAHIRNTHHRYVRSEIARLTPLFEKVVSVHGKNHPELLAMRGSFIPLAQELTTHLMKEEAILFPYIVRLEEAAVEKAPVVPPPFGTVRNPVAMMVHEHDDAGEALRALRHASQGYAPPPDACLSFQTLYQALAAFEADLHQHIHLENNILFPRAIQLETSV